jgi:predicted alpha/beta superfamily hydrolase
MKRGTIKVIESFFMPQLNRKRTIRIYLPSEYEVSDKKYPVIYMHDAQNLFDKTVSAFGMIWEVAETMDRLYNEGKSEGVIIVGIDNGCENRYNEYSPWHNEEVSNLLVKLKDNLSYAGGEGFEYIDFIVKTLKPYIDLNYRTLDDRENTAISGSSMGGFISLAAGIKYQEVFSKIAAFSSAIWFSEKDIVSFIVETGKKLDMKVYMDVGTNETSNNDIKEFPSLYLDGNKQVYDALVNAGFNEDEIKFVIDKGAVHNEKEWARRFPEAIRWIFG